jgi:protein-L-isoaspartate(D-aspartate) O-methyltransferase
MDRDAARRRMVDRLRAGGRVDDERVLKALAAVPRHEFVPEGRRSAAYQDAPLPIGHGQTISAPHMVGIVCELLELAPGDRVLEVGTGCGYHAAVTAELVGPGNVYSVEYEPALAASARDRLGRLGYDVHVRQGDGREGWPEHAPYDAAYLTCAAEVTPPAVVDQTEGYVVAPVGQGTQRLVRLLVGGDGVHERGTHGRVRFVEMR